MEIFLTIVIALSGSAFASFFSVVVYRAEKYQGYRGILFGRSYCDACKKQLVWYELVPIFSYLIQRGKCRECNEKIPLRYWMGEIFFGLGFGLLFTFEGSAIDYLVLTVLGFLALYDYAAHGVPKKIMNLLLVLGFIYRVVLIAFFQPRDLVPLFVAVFASVIFYFVLNGFKKSFGLGDLLVFLFLFFTISVHMVIAVFFFSILIGGLVSSILVLFKKISRKSYVPFIPFIFFAYPLSYVFGEKVLAYFATLLQLW